MTEQAKQAERPLKGAVSGVVKGVSGAKTVKVVVDRLVQDPIYGKYLRRQTKLSVHDPKQDAKSGDTVEIAPCRPMSKTKSWRLVRVVKRAQSV